MPDAVRRFYLDHLPGSRITGNLLRAQCPICAQQNHPHPVTMTVFLNRESFFHGYFWCPNRYCGGGFPLYFARLMAIEPTSVPGYDPDREYFGHETEFPSKNINQEISGFTEKMTPELIESFQRQSISEATLKAMHIGYNGRYLVYPYVQADGNFYSARCIHPDKEEDTFWYGNEDFSSNRFRIFHHCEIERCENGSLVIVEGERNLLPLKTLGLPGIAVPSATDLEHLDPRQFQWLRTVFLWVNNTVESRAAAHAFATTLGYKVRLVCWRTHHPRKYSLTGLARDKGATFQEEVFTMLREARAFSPFATPEREFHLFQRKMAATADKDLHSCTTGFRLLDLALGGLRGLTIMGGTPKAGKSCFCIQIASEIASRKVPVIYYDFENGRQNIYLRILCRWAKIPIDSLMSVDTLTEDEQQRNAAAQKKLLSALNWLRVVNDRQLSPELMRRHVDFLRHETNSDRVVVVIDSLHKLPFKDLTHRRSGIDGWLRQLEAIRDELDVAFLVISELTRGMDGQFEKQPQLGSFKGSGDIAYSADNALVLLPEWDPFDDTDPAARINNLWMVASREQSPGKIAGYRLDYPYWGFIEENGRN